MGKLGTEHLSDLSVALGTLRTRHYNQIAVLTNIITAYVRRYPRDMLLKRGRPYNST